jgi:hypothetical protein
MEKTRSKYGFRPTSVNEKDHDITVVVEIQINDTGEVVELKDSK